MTSQPQSAARVFCDLRIYAARNGDRVTGRVEFPYETHGRTQCPIDYRSTRPSTPRTLEPSNPRTLEPSAHRFQAASQYISLCHDQPQISKRRHAESIARRSGCSLRSIQLWAHKLETEGPDALADHYVKPPRRVPAIDAARASDAVLVCAWWAFRVGTIEVVDTKLMAAAVGPLVVGYPVADLVAAIDCYYAWPCDRAKYPFKPFARWAWHDLQKWVVRAAAGGDYQRAVAAGKRDRIRDTRNRRTRSAIRGLATPNPSDPQTLEPSNPRPLTHSHPRTLGPSDPRTLGPSNPQTAITEAKTLSRLGFRGCAHRHVAASAPGITPLAAKEPETMAESLAQMDDGYRTMLLRVAGRQRDPDTHDARRQAVATLPLWWDVVPARIRRLIDLRLAAWCTEHGIAPGHPGVAARRVSMLIPHLRPDRSGVQTIAAALRLPA